MSTKIVAALVALIAVAAGGYYMMTPKVTAPAAPQDQLPAVQPVTETTAPAAPALAGATDSVDGFSAAIDADLQATTDAIGALDADVDTSVSAVQTSGSNANLYDPNTL